MMDHRNVIYLFSRDKRTHSLFRGSWERAIDELNMLAVPQYRFNGRFGYAESLIRFMRVCKSRRMIFGSSEIALYALVSKSNDIWVFTGLGRLLDGSSSVLSRTLFTFLRLSYRNQKVIVLNTDDFKVLRENLTNSTFLIPGEGYKFNRVRSVFLPIRKGVRYAYVGRLLKSKGILDILESFTSASRIEDELFLFGDFDFGNSDSIDRAVFTTFQNKSKGKIEHKGFVNNVDKALLEVDVVVSMSRREGLPFAILDAIAAGCRIVLSCVPGHKEFAGLDGISFVNSSEELREVMVNLSYDFKRLTILEHQRRLQLAENRFGIDSVITLIKLYLK